MKAQISGMAVAILLAGCAAPPPPPTPVTALSAKVVNYTCSGGKRMTVAYGASTATLAGNEKLVDDGSGRYSWPSDGTHHVWAVAGGVGTLSLHDGTKNTDTVVNSDCKPNA